MNRDSTFRLPAAFVLVPALVAAVLLGIGRAIGETMAVLMATGHAVQIPHSVLDPIRTLTATIAAEMGEASGGQYHALFVIARTTVELVKYRLELLSTRLVPVR